MTHRPDSSRSAACRLNRRARRPASRGFTLLEVILALAILGLAMATLGQAIGHSHLSARRAAEQTELCLAASSLLDEVLTGVRQLVAVEGEAIGHPTDPTEPPIGVASLSIENGSLDGLLVLRAQVRSNDPDLVESVELVRWVMDPSLSESSSTSGGSL